MQSIIIKTIGVVATALLLQTSLHAQQQVQYTQYMYNTMMVNPAYAGTGSKLEAQIIHRSQWVGLDGAPRTQNFGINGAVGKVLGLGLNIINDRIGPSNQFFLTGTVSARIKLTNKVNLSLGINGGMDMVSVDWSKGNYKDQNDAAMASDIRNRVRPVIGAGLYLYGKKWYFGISTPTFITKDHYGDENQARINQAIHYYGIAGYVFDVSRSVKLKPALLIKAVGGAPITGDISLNALFKKQFTVGVAYRFHDAASVLLGYTFKNQLFIGYSYDMSVTKLRTYNNGSHDIILKFNMITKQLAAQTPRFF